MIFSPFAKPAPLPRHPVPALDPDRPLHRRCGTCSDADFEVLYVGGALCDTCGTESGVPVG